MEKETFNQLISGQGLVLVDFYATWCGPCQRMHPILDQLKQQMGDRIRIIKVDVDEQEALAGKYRIQSVPTLILYKDGVQKWRSSGGMTLTQLKERIETEI